MESDIRSLTKELRNYYLQITNAVDDNSLTTLQKQEYGDPIKKALEAKGISYSFPTHWDSPQDHITFYSPNWFVNEVGIIEDVHAKGAFPFTLSIGEDIFISYEPRNLKDKESWKWNDLKNKEFLNFQKGSEYQFKGRIKSCAYFYGTKPEKFTFSIMGGGSETGYCSIATACYGNYDAQEVLILRQFRDDKLLKNSIGKGFVKFYYSVSPFFATQISKSDLLKNLVRRYFLKPIVTKLQRQNNKNT